MRILILPLLLLLSISPQEKDKWERVYTLEDATIALNSAKVEFGEDGMGRVQFRWNYSKLQSLDNSSEARYKTRVEKVAFNCDRRRYRLISYTLLDEKGKTVFAKELEPVEMEWKFVKPGGMMERLLGPACKIIEEKKR
jgi:hypothetical protein